MRKLYGEEMQQVSCLRHLTRKVWSLNKHSLEMATQNNVHLLYSPSLLFLYAHSVNSDHNKTNTQYKHSSEIHHCYVVVTTSMRCLRYSTWLREEKRIWTQPDTSEREIHSTLMGNISIQDTAFILPSVATDNGSIFYEDFFIGKDSHSFECLTGTRCERYATSTSCSR